MALFAARDPIPYLAPVDKLTHEKKRHAYTGIADFLDYFEDPEETPPPVKIETRAERIERKRREKAEQVVYKLEQNLALWDPSHNSDATSNPYKTLFVGRISYDTSESKLRREFEVFGKIKQIKLVHKTDGTPKGYAFIEFEDESSMHSAYKKADGKKIDGKRVVVDIERGRTIEGWKPRRLGGGKGGRKTGEVRSSGRDESDTKVVNRERKGSRERKRSRSRSRERRRRSRSKDRNRSRSRDKNKKSRRSKSKEKTKSKRSRSRDKDHKSSRHTTDSNNGH